MGKKYEKLIELYNNDTEKRADIIYIDGRLKPSASKIKSKNKDDKIVFPDINIEIPEIDFPEIAIPEIEIADNCLQEYGNEFNNILKEVKDE
jgi:hypothetical protein